MKIKAILLIMKLVIIILITVLVQVSAAGFAQRLTYTKKNATLEQVFQEIEKQTGFQVLYSDQKLDDARKLDVNFRNSSLREILDFCLQNQPLTYKIERKTILIRDKIPASQLKAIPLAVIEIRGRITDARNQPMAGVNVTIKASKKGVISDGDGRYSIQVDESDILVFTMVGFKPQEIAVSGKEQLNVVLLEDIGELEQVVVTGYGKKKVSELTGSLVTVKGDDLRNVASASIVQNLKGTMSGLIVSDPGGDPNGVASLNVRGVGSLGGNSSTQPLIVIDGLVQDFTNIPSVSGAANIINLSPNDVESVTLLKDAASTSLYGSRAANGVLVITTKAGSGVGGGKPQVNLESNFSWENPVFGKFRMMNSTERYDLLGQAYTNDYKNLNPTKTDAEVAAYLTTVMPNREEALSHNTDWMREGYRTGKIQRYNLSVSGASEKFNYYVGTTYHKELPVAITDKFERYGLRVNTEYKATQKLTINAGFNGTFSPLQNSGLSNYRSALYKLMPWDYPKNADGSYRLGGANEVNWFSKGLFNPFYSTQEDFNYRYDKIYVAGADVKASYNFNSWLSLSTANRITLTSAKNGFYIDPLDLASGRPGGSYSRNITQNVNYITSNILSFQREFGLHQVKGLAGFEFNNIRNETTGGTTNGITSGLMSLSQGTFQGITESINEVSFLSYLSEANYSYDNRYFVSGSFRRDGSSKFGANNKYGNFYSVGASWTVSNEAFLKNNKIITNLRLRASHGTTGNADPVGPYSIYGVYNYVTGTSQYDGKSGIIPGSNDNNPDLHWEVQQMNNLGLNIGLWNRINLAVDIYDKANTNILRTVQAPITSGVTGVVKNIGKVSNKGIEADLNSLNINGKVKWSTNINVAFNRNKVLYLTDVPAVLPTTGGLVIAPGYAIGTIYGIVYKGADPDTGKPSYEVLKDDGSRSTTLNIKEATLQVLDSQQPDFSGGIGNSVSYKGITLSVLCNFITGLKVNNDLRGYIFGPLEIDGASKTVNNTALPEGQTRWQKKGDQAFAPAASLSGYPEANGYTTTRFIDNASFFRVRNIRLTYDLPSTWLNKVKIGKAALYIAADNVFTITKFTGLDPEVGGGNFENAAKYPINRKITLGLNVVL
ncbi:SusC/RagA family TonB-linked outer membrane protein [Pedobacter frigoris]|uniref:SusC/RagA family TonB-linked outer membrane protein n=2 Tax=Pedobacter frigoris TaxID=2571272 RepID=A0A4V5NYL6_9SPHI|nr:SusC/RagA family TonB-linked outer membrane protein [Pedobacter frigoris]